jgi:hypothetical protein
MNQDTMASEVNLGTAQTQAQAIPGNGGIVKPPFTLAWAAGFVDGEGCISIVKQRYQDPRRKLSYRLCLGISQNNLEVLEHLRDGMGITEPIYKVKRLPQHSRQVYTLNCNGKNALRLITTLLPFLVRKREEAQTAVAYWEDCMGGKRPGGKGWSPQVTADREAKFQKMRSFK